ncbi:hypothetical protein ACFLQ2_05255 [archaeon]
MAKKPMDNTAVLIGVVGGLGLGLLLGTEFAGSFATILGALFIVASLGSMIFLKTKKK